MRYKGSGLLPQRAAISDIRDGVRRRSSQFSHQGDMLQMRLLQVEEKYRSQFLYDQISSFEDKIYRCYENFNVDVLYRMFQGLTKRTVVDVRKVKSLAHLRQCHIDLKKVIQAKIRHRNLQTTPEEEKLVNYFTWYFKYLDYLRDLRDNFVDRIFTPLFRYFYLVGYGLPDRENTDDSVFLAPSAMSFHSVDSGYSGLSGLTSAIEDDDGDRLSLSFSARSGYKETQEARKKIATKQALIALSRQFNDIKKLYDTSEIENLAQRLSHLKERTDHLLDNVNTLDEALLCQDSERCVFHLKIANLGNENLMRFVPDVLLKFQKAAWLARRWLNQDDEKTKDLNEKLEKLTQLEEAMNRRLSFLSKEIQLKEIELESKASLLNNLLEREDRSNDLGESVYNLKKRKETLKEQLNVLISEQGQLSEKLSEAAQRHDKKAYRDLRPFYDRNKLQRFAVERQLATLNYHINLAESDMSVELELKADVMYTTNDVQDTCEELEKRLEKAKQEQKVLQAALIPVAQDRKFIKEKLQVDEDLPVGESKPALKAEYINSITPNPERVVDLNSEFIRQTPIGDPLSLFITSLPGDGHVSSKQVTSTSVQSLPSVVRQNNSSVKPKHSYATQVSQPIKMIDSNVTQQFVPKVMASEW